MHPDTLFRIASISKPITSAAILRLVDQGRLSLDDPVMKRLPHWVPSGSAAATCDSRWNQITVRQVLQHRGGWDRERCRGSDVPLARIATNWRSPCRRPDGYRAFHAGQPLDFDPGQRYAYSNFGYCVLGRVIEQATGRTTNRPSSRRCSNRWALRACASAALFANSERRAKPAITNRVIRRSRRCSALRRVSRFRVPYGTWYHEALDAHGGWIGSAVDLVRFATVVQHATPDGLLHRAC